MPWSIVERGGKYCVVKDSDGSTVKCHTARSDAVKHQRALYANEHSASTAGIEVEWEDEGWPEPAQQPIQIQVGNAPNEVAEALVASMSKLVDRIEEAEARVGRVEQRVERSEEQAAQDRQALVAAFAEMSESVTAAVAAQPEVRVEIPEIQIPAPNVTVQPPEVNVTVEGPPVSRREVVVKRDPETGLIAGASVEEVDAG